MKYINQLEPDSLIESFLRYPPVGFSVGLTESGLPFFSTKFNLLTTADIDFQKKLRAFPFYNRWSKLLQPRTCFIGATVSEYALLSQTIDAEQLAEQLTQQFAKEFPFLIVKDIPQCSPLLTEQANDYCKVFINALTQREFISVEGQALAWVPIDFIDIDDYLSRLSHSRRKDFRRKLKARTKVDIQVLQSGDDCFFEAEVLDNFYQLYLNVYQQSEIHFDLLSKEFFVELLQNKQEDTKIFCYYHMDKLIGYNICFVVNDMLVDKYIGFIYPEARTLNLYYISWFYNLEYAKQQGLNYYIAGWTDPEVKASLGAKFTFTQHMVYVRNPILRVILNRLSSRFESDRSWQESYNKIQNK